MAPDREQLGVAAHEAARVALRIDVRRPAGLALPVTAEPAVPIGDAAVTRNALASQGAAVALSDACLAAAPALRRPSRMLPRTDARERHVRHQGKTLKTCRYAAEPTRDS